MANHWKEVSFEEFNALGHAGARVCSKYPASEYPRSPPENAEFPGEGYAVLGVPAPADELDYPPRDNEVFYVWVEDDEIQTD